MKHPFHLLPFLRRFAEQCATCAFGIMALLVFVSNYGAQHVLWLSKTCDTGYANRLIALQWQVLSGDGATYIIDVVLSLLSDYLF
jgi:hypothetical protein